MKGAFDWFARVVMLVLAGLVSLSIIGAIAAIPSGSIDTRLGVEFSDRLPESQPEAEPEPAGPDRASSPAQERAASDQPSSEGERMVQGAPEAAPADPARWLEAITYALMALVGIAAFCALLLWRTLHERRRIAEALERLASR